MIGLFFVQNVGDRSCCGRIVSKPAPGKYLLEFDRAPEGPVLPMELVDGDDLAGFCDACDDARSWGFFRTRVDLDAWMEWIAAPGPDAAPKVVAVPHKGAQ